MVAVPFKGVVESTYGSGAPGPAYRFSANDVAGGMVTFDDIPGTPSFIQFPAGLRLSDIKISAAGTDTKALVVTRGTETTSRIFRQAPLVETLALDGKQRLGNAFGLPLAPGLQYGIKQLT